MEYVDGIMNFQETRRIIALAIGLVLLAVLLWCFSSLQHKWNEARAMQERRDWFDHMFEEVNKAAGAHDCKTMSATLFEQVINSIEASGNNAEDFGIDRIIEEAVAINPTLKMPS